MREKKRLQRQVSAEPFRPGGSRRRLKHENLMKRTEGDAGLYPYSSSPYDAAREYYNEQKRLSEEKVLEGPFVCERGKLKSDKISYLPEVVKLLFKIIQRDWEDSNFQGMTTDDRKIVFRFEKGTVDSLSALSGYMDVMSLTNEFIRRARMKRQEGEWAVEDEECWILFTFSVLD